MQSKEGLSKDERITRKFEYSRVISKNRMIAGVTLKAYFLLEEGVARRAGFVAGKGVGNAVVRNRARRLLRESYRRLKPDLPEAGFEVVFVAGPRIGKADSHEVQAEMKRIFEKIGLLN